MTTHAHRMSKRQIILSNLHYTTLDYKEEKQITAVPVLYSNELIIALLLLVLLLVLLPGQVFVEPVLGISSCEELAPFRPAPQSSCHKQCSI